MTKTNDVPLCDAKYGSERRTSVRISMLLLATIKFDDTLPSTTSRVRDLSKGGIRITLPVHLKRGHPVKANIKGVGEVCGRVTWARNGEVGIKFDTKINTDMIVQALTGAPVTTHIQFAKAPVPRPGFHVR